MIIEWLVFNQWAAIGDCKLNVELRHVK